jgi:hypothetical protein
MRRAGRDGHRALGGREKATDSEEVRGGAVVYTGRSEGTGSGSTAHGGRCARVSRRRRRRGRRRHVRQVKSHLQFGSSVGIEGYPSTGNDEREAVSRLDGCETAIRVPVLLVYRSIVGAHILVGGGRIRIRRWVTDKRGRVGPRVGTRM